MCKTTKFQQYRTLDEYRIDTPAGAQRIAEWAAQAFGREDPRASFDHISSLDYAGRSEVLLAATTAVLEQDIVDPPSSRQALLRMSKPERLRLLDLRSWKEYGEFCKEYAAADVAHRISRH